MASTARPWGRRRVRLEARGGRLSARGAQQEQQAGETRGGWSPGVVREVAGEGGEAAHPSESSRKHATLQAPNSRSGSKYQMIVIDA